MISRANNHAISRFACKLIGTAALSGLLATAHAAEVVLVPASPIDNLGVGDVFDLNVLIDFSDIPGNPGGTLGGGFDIDFDAAVLTLFGLSSSIPGDPQMARDPDLLEGLLESWAVGNFDGIATAGQVLVGTVQFRVSSTTANQTQVSIGPTDSLGGPWISGNDFVSELAPFYNQVTITLDPDSLHSSGFESN